MNFLARNRALSAGIAALALLLVFWMSRVLVQWRPTKIADFTLPALRGWTREIKTTQSTRFISYTKKVGDDRLFLKLTWHEKDSQNPPKTIADLQAFDVKNQASMATVVGKIASQFGVSTPVIQRVSTQPTTLNGMPALLIKDFLPGSKPTQMQLLLFTNGRNFYDLLANHSAPKNGVFSPAAQNELDGAWQTLSTRLAP